MQGGVPAAHAIQTASTTVPPAWVPSTRCYSMRAGLYVTPILLFTPCPPWL